MLFKFSAAKYVGVSLVECGRISGLSLKQCSYLTTKVLFFLHTRKPVIMWQHLLNPLKRRWFFHETQLALTNSRWKVGCENLRKATVNRGNTLFYKADNGQGELTLADYR